MPSTQEWIRQKFEEERQLGINVEYNNMRLTKELEEVKEDIKKLQIDLAYMMNKYGELYTFRKS